MMRHTVMTYLVFGSVALVGCGDATIGGGGDDGSGVGGGRMPRHRALVGRRAAQPAARLGRAGFQAPGAPPATGLGT